MSHPTIEATVQEQFNRCAPYYLKDSAMADQKLLHWIVQLSEPQANDRTLDVACGAGFLVHEFAKFVCHAIGVDLSKTMLREARKYALELGLANTSFKLAHAELLPFADEAFNIVSCKLALHYFTDPKRTIREMNRVAKSGARFILIDRVSSEDQSKREYHNRIEKLRTPSKVKVYSTSEITDLMKGQGLSIIHTHYFEQHQDFEEWIKTTGASEENQQHARQLIGSSLKEDLTGLKVRLESGKLRMTHTAAILVAKVRERK